MSNMGVGSPSGSPFGTAQGKTREFAANVSRTATQISRGLERQWTGVNTRVPVRSIAIGVIVAAIVAMLAVGINRLVSSSEAARSDAGQASAPQTNNLSNGRDGNPFVIVGGRPIFPVSAGSLSLFANAPVEMQDVVVVAYIDDVGFWVGHADSEKDQLFVRMRPATAEGLQPLSLPVLEVGDKVNLTGYMREVDRDPELLGLTDPKYVELLDRQGYAVEANSVRPQ